MSTLPASLAPSRLPGTIAARVFRAAIRAAGSLARAFVHRREVKRLLELDDRMLRDVGLRRNDVLGALAEPLSQDPSVLLRLRSVDHRARQRASAAHARALTVPRLRRD